MGMAKRGIKRNLFMGFGIALGLTILIAGSGIWSVKRITGTVIKTINTNLSISQNASKARIDTLQLRRYEKDMLINLWNSEKVKGYKEKWDKEHADLLARIADLEKVITDPKDKERIEQIKRDMKIYASNIAELYDLLTSRTITTVKDGNDYVNKVKDNVHGVETVARDMAADASAKTASLGKEILLDSGHATLLMIILSGIAVLLGIAISMVIIRSITGPLNRVVAGLSEASDQVASASGAYKGTVPLFPHESYA